MASVVTAVPEISQERSFFDWLIHLYERFLLHVMMFLALPAWAVSLAWVFSLRSPLCDILTHTMMHVLVLTSVAFVAAILLFWLRRKSNSKGAWFRRFLLLAIPLPFLTSIVQPWLLLPLTPRPVVSRPTTKILVWNMYLMNYNSEEVEAMIQKHQPDILALIECNPETNAWLKPIRKEYVSELMGVSWRSQSMLVLTKFPDAKMELLDVEGMKTASVRFRPKGSTDEHQLFVIHTLSPKWPGNRVEIRNAQLMNLADMVRQEESTPQIVMGDFNTSPWSRIFGKLLFEGKLTDTRDYRGYYSSWPSLFVNAGIPIDHALVNQHVKVVGRCVLEEGDGSDHRPLVLEIE